MNVKIVDMSRLSVSDSWKILKMVREVTIPFTQVDSVVHATKWEDFWEARAWADKNVRGWPAWLVEEYQREHAIKLSPNGPYVLIGSRNEDED